MTDQPSGKRLPRPLRPFRHREYRLLVTSMAASLFASGLWLVAIVYQVIALGGGPTELSVVATASAFGLLVGAFAPSIALLLAAGIYAFAAVTLVAMRSVAVPPAAERSSVLGDLAEGFRYLFRTG